MPQPTVSVVIASGIRGEFLFRCLDSLRSQAKSQSAEVIVVDRCGDEVMVRLSRDYPFVTAIPAELNHRPSIPELRQIGARKAGGDIVSVIEKYCIAPPDWLETIRSSFREGDIAIGGPMLPGNSPRLCDWVVYFCEYHNYLPPWVDGDRDLLAGSNIAYRREALMRHVDVLGEGYWDVVLHPALRKEGTFHSVPAMGSYHTGPFDYGYYLKQRYLLSRSWAGTERKRISPGKWLVYLVVAPILPFVFLTRIAQRVFKSRCHIGRFLEAIPLLIPVLIAYVWGEWLGYLFGPGNALEFVE